jgi:dTMP kinase
MKQGTFIVFEGVSGTGKETQAKLLQEYLKNKGIVSHIVFHPTSALKPALRKAKSPQEQISLLAHDRKKIVDSVIIPALAKGQWVISLRNYVSAMVYQGDKEKVKKIDIQPDVLFYFDILPDIAMERIISRGETRGKYEKINLLTEKRKKYKEVLSHIPHITIDAVASIDDIHKKVMKCIL